jgi:hypothetical protein
MLRRLLVIAFFISTAICSGGQTASGASPKLVAPLRPMLEALDRAKVSGSLELSGHCDAGRPPHLPRLRTLSTNGNSLLQNLREMFAEEPAMRVTQDPDGTIRMSEGGAAAELLNVKDCTHFIRKRRRAVPVLRLQRECRADACYFALARGCGFHEGS